MTLRYSKRLNDGTVVYYSSQEELEAHHPPVQAGILDFNPLAAGIGFIGTLIASWIVFSIGHFDDAWPQWAKFAAVIGSAGLGGYTIGRLGVLLWFMFWAAVTLAIVTGIGAIIWQSL